MTRDVATVRSTDPMALAAKRMEERDCGSVVVLGASSEVLGVLTDRDVCLAALRSDAPLSTLVVEDHLSGRLHSCSPEDTVQEAERRMGQHQVRRLPVVDAGGRLRGILSLDDFAREARREADLIAPPVSSEDVGRTLGQIGRPHLIESEGAGGAR